MQGAFRPVSVADGTCIVGGCERPVCAKGKCASHHSLEYNKRVAAERRAAWIEAAGGRCVKCGGTERLEVDHIDPASKEIEIAALWMRRVETRERELAKCQLLCRACHHAKNAMEQPPRHGLRGWRRGCRCLTCRAAMDRQNDRARERRRAAA